MFLTQLLIANHDIDGNTKPQGIQFVSIYKIFRRSKNT